MIKLCVALCLIGMTVAFTGCGKQEKEVKAVATAEQVYTQDAQTVKAEVKGEAVKAVPAKAEVKKEEAAKAAPQKAVKKAAKKGAKAEQKKEAAKPTEASKK